MTKLRIGVVGAGGIVRSRHLPGLLGLPDVEITAVANSSLESSRKFIEDGGLAAEAMDDWQALVRRDDIDIVWIGATPFLHEPVTVAALQAEKHVFCQARMARNAQEGESMLRAAEARPDLVTMLCPPPMGLAQDAWFKSLLADHVAGPIGHVQLQSLNGSFLDTAGQPLHWRQRRDISGNNIMTLGIYTEVLQRWFGDAANLTAEAATRSAGADIPDQLDVLGRFSSGVTFNLRFSGVHSGPPVQCLQATGTGGQLEFDFNHDKIFLLSSDGNREELTPPDELRRPWAVEADFIQAVRNPEAPRPHPDFHDGVAYMRVVDAVHESLKSGQRVLLPQPNRP